jgi:L-ascorbate metabolism protein UlaG (beta-lactamase superfamily)
MEMIRTRRLQALILGIVMVGAPGGAAELEVTTVANEGFLVRSGSKSVLVDALFRATGPYPEFFQQGPSDELLGRMLAGEGEFSRIDVALVTHHHADHHDASTAVEFLRRHRETVLVGTEAVLESMKRLSGFGDLRDRVLAPAAALDECVNLEVHGIRVSACKVRHSGSPEVTNIVYRVDLEGASFVHEGDAELSGNTFGDLGLGKGGLDVAFVHSWWVTSDEGRETILRWLQPRSIVLMHHRWSKAHETRERLTQLSATVLESLPPVTVFGREGERKLFAEPTGDGDESEPER